MVERAQAHHRIEAAFHRQRRAQFALPPVQARCIGARFARDGNQFRLAIGPRGEQRHADLAAETEHQPAFHPGLRGSSQASMK